MTTHTSAKPVTPARVIVHRLSQSRPAAAHTAAARSARCPRGRPPDHLHGSPVLINDTALILINGAPPLHRPAALHSLNREVENKDWGKSMSHQYRSSAIMTY